MQALYRKWRPQKFSELVGQEHIKKTLQNALTHGRIAHAYLFAGPRGSGKTTTARLLAKSVNCLDFREGEPCNKCASCLEIQGGQSLDLIEIDAASNRGIEEIKALREKIKFAPSKAKYKVYVIDECHMLTREAFNALLKTLEEPPPYVIFVLATTEAHRVPQTILSRCQRFDFRRLSVSNLVERLTYIAEKENLDIEEEAKELLAQAASGSVRDAESLLDTVLGRGTKKITKEIVKEILGKTEEERIKQLYEFMVKKETSSALALLNQVVEDGKDLNQFTTNLIEFLREKLLNEPSIVLASWIRIISQAQKEMKLANLMQLPLELAIVEITYQNHEVKKDKELIEKGKEKKEQEEQKTQEKKNEIENINKEEDCPISEIDWEGIIRQIRPHNHSLCFLLKSSQPLEIKDGQIVLGVSFKFHKDKLEEIRNKKIIEEVIKKVTGKNLTITCKVVKGLAKMEMKDNNLDKAVEEVFKE